MPPEEIPLKPISRSDIHRLETALIIATLLRKDVLEKIRDSTERLTWIDSLAVAAGALARARAGMTATQIADDLGRSEATIRRHLSGKTEAAKLVEETYRRFLQEGVKIELPIGLGGEDLSEKVRELEEKIKILENDKKKLEEKMNQIKKLVNELAKVVGE